jgi:hypothetical protein
MKTKFNVSQYSSPVEFSLMLYLLTNIFSLQVDSCSNEKDGGSGAEQVRGGNGASMELEEGGDRLNNAELTEDP